MSFYSDFIEDSICFYDTYYYEDYADDEYIGYADEPPVEIEQYRVIHKTENGVLIEDTKKFLAAWFPASKVTRGDVFVYPGWLSPKWFRTFNPETDFQIED